MNKKIMSLVVSLSVASSMLLGVSTATSANTKKDSVKIKFFTGKVETVDLMNDIIKDFNSKKVSNLK